MVRRQFDPARASGKRVLPAIVLTIDVDDQRAGWPAPMPASFAVSAPPLRAGLPVILREVPTPRL